MTARFFFWVLAVAFAIWLILALLTTSSSGGEPPTTTTSPEPPTPPATTGDGQVRRLQSELRAERARHAGAARAFRRRLRYVIHHATSSGSHWLERAFACVHVGEGAWNANTGNGYYGGLQFDLSFQRAYAPWALRAFGTANNWPVSVQESAAIEAYEAGRGFQPWPDTARACGLIR